MLFYLSLVGAMIVRYSCQTSFKFDRNWSVMIKLVKQKPVSPNF